MMLAALLIGVLIAAQGVFGLAAPEMFLRVLRVIQTAPLIYLAAVVRISFGLVLWRAAAASRTPLVLRVLAAVVLFGGLITPFFGEQLGHALLDWWAAGGAPLIRAWAAFFLALGAFIVWSVAQSGRLATRDVGTVQ